MAICRGGLGCRDEIIFSRVGTYSSSKRKCPRRFRHRVRSIAAAIFATSSVRPETRSVFSAVRSGSENGVAMFYYQQLRKRAPCKHRFFTRPAWRTSSSFSILGVPASRRGVDCGAPACAPANQHLVEIALAEDQRARQTRRQGGSSGATILMALPRPSKSHFESLSIFLHRLNSR